MATKKKLASKKPCKCKEEQPVFYYQADTIDAATWEILCEMMHKGIKVYVQKVGQVDVWISAGNPDQSIFNFLKNTTKKVAFASGKPVNPPPCPPGGCQ